jgi:hypothetical protein
MALFRHCVRRLRAKNLPAEAGLPWPSVGL